MEIDVYNRTSIRQHQKTEITYKQLEYDGVFCYKEMITWLPAHIIFTHLDFKVSIAHSLASPVRSLVRPPTGRSAVRPSVRPWQTFKDARIKIIYTLNDVLISIYPLISQH